MTHICGTCKLVPVFLPQTPLPHMKEVLNFHSDRLKCLVYGCSWSRFKIGYETILFLLYLSASHTCTQTHTHTHKACGSCMAHWHSIFSHFLVQWYVINSKVRFCSKEITADFRLQRSKMCANLVLDKFVCWTDNKNQNNVLSVMFCSGIWLMSFACKWACIMWFDMSLTWRKTSLCVVFDCLTS